MYITSGAAARRIGISKQAFLRAVKRGEIEPILRTPGGYFRFLVPDVEAYARRLSPRQGDPEKGAKM